MSKVRRASHGASRTAPKNLVVHALTADRTRRPAREMADHASKAADAAGDSSRPQAALGHPVCSKAVAIVGAPERRAKNRRARRRLVRNASCRHAGARIRRSRVALGRGHGGGDVDRGTSGQGANGRRQRSKAAKTRGGSFETATTCQARRRQLKHRRYRGASRRSRRTPRQSHRRDDLAPRASVTMQRSHVLNGRSVRARLRRCAGSASRRAEVIDSRHGTRRRTLRRRMELEPSVSRSRNCARDRRQECGESS